MYSPMPVFPEYKNDPLQNDSLYIHQLALHRHKKDSVLLLQKTDSLKQSKIIHWNTIVQEAEKHDHSLQRGNLAPSVFHGHQLRKDSGIRTKKINANADWMLGVILVALFLLSAVRQLNNKRFLSYLRAFFTLRFAGQLQREEYAISNRTAGTLLTCFVMILSLFIFQVLDHYDLLLFNLHPFVTYLYLCAAITGIYLIKVIVIRLLAFIFKAESQAAEYLFYLLLFNQVLGIALLPVVTGIAFIRSSIAPGILYTGWGLMAIVFIYRILRTASIGFSKPKISRFYLFLYLCTLEFLPLLFAIKFLGSL